MRKRGVLEFGGLYTILGQSKENGIGASGGKLWEVSKAVQ